MTPEQIEESKKSAGLFPELNPSAEYELIAIESTDRGDAYVIVSSDDKSKKSFYSVETGLKLMESSMMEQMGQSFEISTTFMDYKPTEGVLMPYKILQKMGPQNFEINLNEIMVNQDIPADKFQ
jgi:hypothetical protein